MDALEVEHQRARHHVDLGCGIQLNLMPLASGRGPVDGARLDFQALGEDDAEAVPF